MPLGCGDYVHEIALLWERGIEEALIGDDEPARCVRLAFDDAGRPWELAALSFGNGARYLVIHAMPARRSVIDRM